MLRPPGARAWERPARLTFLVPRRVLLSTTNSHCQKCPPTVTTSRNSQGRFTQLYVPSQGGGGAALLHGAGGRTAWYDGAAPSREGPRCTEGPLPREQGDLGRGCRSCRPPGGGNAIIGNEECGFSGAPGRLPSRWDPLQQWRVDGHLSSRQASLSFLDDGGSPACPDAT